MTPVRKKIYACVIIALFCLIIVGGVGNFRAKQLAVEIAAGQVDQTLALVARDLDPARLANLIETQDEGDPFYQELRERIIRLKEEHLLADIALLHKTPKQGWIYIMDSREESDSERKALGERERQPSKFMERTWNGQPVISDYHTTARGAVVSRYLLIKDPQGRPLGLMRGDFAAEEMTAFLFTTRYVQIGVSVIALALIGGILLVGSRRQT